MHSSSPQNLLEQEKYYKMALKCFDRNDYYNGAQYMLRASKSGHSDAKAWVLKEKPIEKLEAERNYKLGLSYASRSCIDSLALPKMKKAAKMGHTEAQKWLDRYRKEQTNLTQNNYDSKKALNHKDIIKKTGNHMNLTIEELTDKAQDQYNRQRYEESLVSAKAAIDIDEECVDGWWFAALSHLALGDSSTALEALEVVVDLAPHFANGWARYGSTLQAIGLDEEAQDAFEMAIEKDDNHIAALTALAGIYQKNNNDDQAEIDKEIRVLSQLDEVEGWLTSNQLNRLGIRHYTNKSFFDAIKYWGRNIHSNATASNLFNLGLAYNHPEVSQDADAIDIWRLTQKRFPEYKHAPEKVKSLLPRLLKLKEKTLGDQLVLLNNGFLETHFSMEDEGLTLLDQKQWYKYYINPFELIDLKDGQFDAADKIDIKYIQKLKKQLKQEIELENGKVAWLKGLQIDLSKAIGVCDDLNDETNREFHWQIFTNKPLLGFLTRGEHKHFTVDKEWSPLETIEYLENHDNGFRKWLSALFTKQFNLVLSTAIIKENLAVLEVLLDGRRWIEPSYTTQCFEGAQKKIDLLLENLREAKEKAEEHKPTVDDIDRLLNKNSLLQMLNLFPTFFWGLQDEAVGIVRSITVSCYNNHKDSDLSKSILNLSKEFLFKSAEANKRLQSDFEAIENIIQEERKAEVSLTKGDDRWEITKDGIRNGKSYIPSDSVASARWGAMLSGDYSDPTHDFLFVFNSTDGSQIKFQWKASQDLEKDKKFNKQLIDAIFQYILPGVIKKVSKQLKFTYNNTVKIGHCSITKAGIEFDTKGWLFSKSNFIPWSRVEFNIENGDLVVKDKFSTKIKTALSLREVDNAFILQFLQETMN
jgi:hypothetical protein